MAEGSESWFEPLRQALSARPRTVIRDAPVFTVPPTSAAVLVPLFERAGEHYLVLTRRTESVREHKGQISFPGGARDPRDVTLLETALRETEEELGIDPAMVKILGVLDDYLTVTNYQITPFVGAIPPDCTYHPHADEVAEVLEVPLRFLADPARHRRELWEWEGSPREVYHLDAGSCVIWGATARIVLQLLATWNTLGG
jgi:8-oxo-dGTP pyrophosphatase MutT (NUDIX family)